MSKQITFLDATDTTGSGTLVEEVSQPHVHVGFSPGRYTLVAWGTWDGATVSLELSPDGGTTWIAITGASFTDDGAANIDTQAGLTYRGAVSGAGASTSVTLKAWL
jgi:hypothetical protein